MRRRFAVIIVPFLFLAGCSSPDADAPAHKPSTSSSAASEISAAPEVPMASLEAGRRLSVSVTDWNSAQQAVDAGVRHLFFGTGSDFSILNGQGDPERSIAALNQRAGEPVTVSVDEEGGLVQRLSDLIGELPSAKRMAETMTPDQVRDMIRAHGEKMRALGITMDFAPVVDLAGGEKISDNAIGSRSFSADPQIVIDYARAFAEGLQQAGIAPVLKHYPGHGHATGDSHLGSVTTPAWEDLKKADLLPFDQLSMLPGMSVMVGHMLVPGKGELPASINKEIYRQLREQGFGGQVITDDLSGMAAVADQYTPEQAAVAALEAGADTALVAAGAVNLRSVVAAVQKAIDEGRIAPRPQPQNSK